MTESSSKIIHSERYGTSLRSKNGGRTWTGQLSHNGKKKQIGTHPTEELAAHAYARACQHYGKETPQGFPQLSDADKAELDAMSEEQLQASFKAAGQVFSHGSSAFRGVGWHKRKQKWRARISVGGVNEDLGFFDNEKDAAEAYDRAVLARDGIGALTNFSAASYGYGAGVEGGTVAAAQGAAHADAPAAARVPEASQAAAATDSSAADASMDLEEEPKRKKSRRALLDEDPAPSSAPASDTNSAGTDDGPSMPPPPARTPNARAAQSPGGAAEEVVSQALQDPSSTTLAAQVQAALAMGFQPTNDEVPGYNLPDWAGWGGDLAAYAWDPDTGGGGSAAEGQGGSAAEGQDHGQQGEGSPRPEPGTVAWSLMFGSDSEDRKNAGHDDEDSDSDASGGVPGMTAEDLRAYLASSRLEPNLHMFTNPLYPPARNRLQGARDHSFRCFMAALRGDWQDRQLWEACEAAGAAHMKAVGEHESSSEDEGDAPMPDMASAGTDSKGAKDAPAGDAAAKGDCHAPLPPPQVAPPVIHLEPGSGWRRIGGVWVERVALPGDPQFQGFAPEPDQAASGGAGGHSAPGVSLQPVKSSAPGNQLLQAVRHEGSHSDPLQHDGPEAELDADEDEPVAPDDDADEETWEAYRRARIARQTGRLNALRTELRTRTEGLDARMLQNAAAAEELERMRGEAQRAKHIDALLRADLAASQAWAQQVAAGNTDAQPPMSHFRTSDLTQYAQRLAAGDTNAPLPEPITDMGPAVREHPANRHLPPCAPAQLTKAEWDEMEEQCRWDDPDNPPIYL